MYANSMYNHVSDLKIDKPDVCLQSHSIPNTHDEDQVVELDYECDSSHQEGQILMMKIKWLNWIMNVTQAIKKEMKVKMSILNHLSK